MNNELDLFIGQVKKSFTFGGLHQYLTNTTSPDVEVVTEYLNAIEQGDDLYHKDEDAQVKAYTLLQKLRLLKETNQTFFMR